jgi:hypothetical protein
VIDIGVLFHIQLTSIINLYRAVMTTPPNPPPNPPPSLPANTWLGRFTQKVVISYLEFVDWVFYGLMGQLGRTVYGSIQDAIAIGIILKLPGLIGEIIIGKDFSGFDICLKESPWGVSRYACFIIVASDFLLWIVLAGRIIARFWADLKDLKNNP